MTDLVSRQEAIDALNEYFVRIGKLKRRGLTQGEKAISLDTVGAIKTLPFAYPKNGKWIVWDEIVAGIYHTVSECSECGFTTDKMSREEMLYCPNCGADMRGIEDD